MRLSIQATAITFTFSIFGLLFFRLSANVLNFHLNKYIIHTPGSISFQVKCKLSKSISL